MPNPPHRTGSRAAAPALLALHLTLALACDRGTSTVTPTTAPSAQAYVDGFEVVVFDPDPAGAPANIRALPLRDAERAVLAGSKAALPADVAPVQQALALAAAAGKSGDTTVTVDVKNVDGGAQRVRLTFQQSSRTYAYEYQIVGDAITPIASDYRDLANTRSVKYVPG